MKTIRAISILLLSSAVAPFVAIAAAQQADTIVWLSESVFRRGDTSNVFVVTSEEPGYLI